MIVVPSMRGGGSEKVMSILANSLDRQKFDITLVLLEKEGSYLKDLNSDLKIIDLKSSKARYSMLKLLKLIKASKPDIVFSTLGYLNLILSFLKVFLPKEIKFVARESSIVSISNQFIKYPKLLNFLYKNLYNNLDLIITQSKYMKEDLIKNFKIFEDKMIVINNPVEHDEILKLSKEKSSLNLKKKNLLNIGSLRNVKNQSVLLDVINSLDSSYHLTILGTGELETELIEKISQLGLSDRVTLKGFEANPYKFLKDADCLLISSIYEGFPNVALEAITCSTPVIAFDCPGGIREIVENGENGFLVEFGNVEMMVSKINKLEIPKEKIYSTSIKYKKEYILKAYENAIESLYPSSYQLDRLSMDR